MSANPEVGPARKRRHTLWLTILGTVALAGLLPVFGSGCGQEKAAAKADDSVPLATIHPNVQTFRRYILQPGIVESYEETPLYSKLAGFVQIPDQTMDIGKLVKKGEVLCTIYVPEVADEVAVRKARVSQGEFEVKQSEENLRAAKANVETCRANVDVAKQVLNVVKANHERWQKEVTRANGPLDKVYPKETVVEIKKQLEATIAAVKEKTENVSAAEAALEESIARAEQADVDVRVSKANLEVWRAEYRYEVAWYGYHRITAPYDGIITRRDVHTGHFVQPDNSGTTSKSAEPLFTVMRTDVMRVVIQVPEYDAPLVKDGADAIVRFQAYRGEDVHGKVTRTSWSLDNEVRTLRVEVFLTNPNHDLRPGQDIQPGMYANVSIAADVPNATTVPSNAVLTDGNKRYCFMLEDGVARRVNVHAGITNEKVTELLGKEEIGLKAGQRNKMVKLTGKEDIIISNLKSLQDGQKARPMTPEEFKEFKESQLAP